MTDREPEPVSYCPRLRLRAVRFIDDNTLELDFEGIDTAGETFRLSRSNDNSRGVWLYNFNDEFARRYRATPGVYAGAGLERLGSYFFAARHSELPAGASYEHLKAEAQSALAERWRQAHPDGPTATSPSTEP